VFGREEKVWARRKATGCSKCFDTSRRCHCVKHATQQNSKTVAVCQARRTTGARCFLQRSRCSLSTCPLPLRLTALATISHCLQAHIMRDMLSRPRSIPVSAKWTFRGCGRRQRDGFEIAGAFLAVWRLRSRTPGLLCISSPSLDGRGRSPYFPHQFCARFYPQRQATQGLNEQERLL
jgi:hypothetical protein